MAVMFDAVTLLDACAFGSSQMTTLRPVADGHTACTVVGYATGAPATNKSLQTRDVFSAGAAIGGNGAIAALACSGGARRAPDRDRASLSFRASRRECAVSCKSCSVGVDGTAAARIGRARGAGAEPPIRQGWASSARRRCSPLENNSVTVLPGDTPAMLKSIAVAADDASV